MTEISGAVSCLVQSLFGHISGQLLVDILSALALNNIVDNVGLNVLYNKPTQCCHESEYEESDTKNYFYSRDQPEISADYNESD